MVDEQHNSADEADGSPLTQSAPGGGTSTGVGKLFARSVSFLAISAIIARLTGLASQLVLGRMLTDEQFGAFSIALGYMIVTGCLRGGEVHHYLQTLAPGRFNRDAAPYVRVAFVASMIGTVATLIAAVVAAYTRTVPMLPAVLVILAVHSATPFLNAPLRSRMQVDQRFGFLTIVDTLNSLLRIVVVVVFAFGGAGAMTLAIQLLVSAIVEAIILWWVTRVPVFGMLLERGGEREALRTVKWTILTGIASTSVLQGDYFAASFFAPAGAVGVYYFMFGLCNQSAYMAASMLREAVGPAIARVREDTERRVLVAVRIARGLAVIIPCLVFAVPVVFPELDLIVWKGRWGKWEWEAMLLSAHVSFLIMATLLYGTLQGMRDFRTPAKLECARAIAIIVGAGAGAAISPTPMGITVGVLAIGGVTSAINAVCVLKSLGIGVVRATRLAFVPTLAGGLLAVVVRIVIDHNQGWSGATKNSDPRWLLEMAVAGFVFLGLYALVARIFFRAVVADMVTVAPARIAKYLRYIA